MLDCFYDFLLAFMAHYMINDGEQWGVLVPITLLFVFLLLQRSGTHINGQTLPRSNPYWEP